MTVLAGLTVLAVLESALPSFCLSYKIQHNEATMAGLAGMAVSAVMAVSVMTATPLTLEFKKITACHFIVLESNSVK